MLSNQILCSDWSMAHQGVSQLWVRVRARTPSLWKVLNTPRLVPMLWPLSTVMKLAILPPLWASIISGKRMRDVIVRLEAQVWSHTLWGHRYICLGQDLWRHKRKHKQH